MPRDQGAYERREVVASRAVLAELMTILRGYASQIVLIGGWVPYFLIPEVDEDTGEHIGSLDVDLLLSPEIASQTAYVSVMDLLQAAGYWQRDPLHPNQLWRTVDGVEIKVDLLTVRPPDASPGEIRHLVQTGLLAREMGDSTLALRNTVWVQTHQTLPDGSPIDLRFQIVNAGVFLLLKGRALGRRYSYKDAYDIYMICRYHVPEGLAEQIRPVLDDPDAQEGLEAIFQHFRGPDDTGPHWVARFLGYAGQEGEARMRALAQAVVGRVLRRLPQPRPQEPPASGELIVVDLEATCWDNRPDKRQEMEIIEIGAVRVGAADGRVVDVFQSFVRPLRNPVLSPFCLQLTGIAQAEVDHAPAFPQALSDFLAWIDGDPAQAQVASWGRYDWKQLRQDCAFHGLDFPFRDGAHLNVKTLFASQYDCRPCGLNGALSILGLEFEGNLHRAVDDVQNVARIYQRILAR